MDIYEKLTFTPLVIVNNSAIGSCDQIDINAFNQKVKEYFLYKLEDYGLEVYNVKPESYCIPQSVATYRINEAYAAHMEKYGISRYSNQVIYINIHANDMRSSWGSTENEIHIYYRENKVISRIITTIKDTLRIKNIKKRSFKNILPVALEVQINYIGNNKNSFVKIIDEIVFAYFLELGITRDALINYKQNKELHETIKELEQRIADLEVSKDE